MVSQEPFAGLIPCRPKGLYGGKSCFSLWENIGIDEKSFLHYTYNSIILSNVILIRV